VGIEEVRVVITGGARGIGAALAARFLLDGHEVITADLDGGDVRCDVSVESDIVSLIDGTGEIDVFVSNAGIGIFGGTEVSNDDWERIWKINTMSHVWAARRLLPGWLARGRGYFVQVVSAAGLLTQIGSAPYAVTKHAALAFAEWLHVTHYDAGIRVSAVCPLGVKTGLLDEAVEQGAGFLLDGVIEPDAVADAVLNGIAEERFLILPHPQALEYFRFKAADYEKWLRGMRKLKSQWVR